ncbi:MAG: histidine phosphatase family protein [Peptoniphilus sp.]|nr:histidine phosphatase family protein [Peptoniphilus sp.]
MIYLIRHGKAEPHSHSDFDRELTEQGKIELEKNFQEFKKDFKSADFKVYTSPYTRAVQTAEIFCRIFETDYEILEDLGFGNDGYAKVVKSLGDGDYILIGHQPYISEAIYELTGANVPVKKGSIHRVR